MKRLLLLCVLTTSMQAHAHFWQGFMNGMNQATQQILRQQQIQRQREVQQERLRQQQEAARRQQEEALRQAEDAKVTKEYKSEEDGYAWYKTKQYGKYGAETTGGQTIIPPKYTFVCYLITNKGQGYFKVAEKDSNGNESQGAYEKDGTYVIPTSRGYDKVFKMTEDDGYYYDIKKNGKEGACDASGREIIAPQYESVFYSSTDHTFYYKNSSGEYVNTGITLQGSSYASSSNNSTSKSTSNSPSSSSSSSSTQPTWLYRGWYYESTDGIDINTGVRMSQLGGSAGTIKMQFTVYEDHLEVATETDVQDGNATKISYSGIENGWRVYRSVSGEGRWRMDQRYYVNSNYDIKYIINTAEYPIVKENENLSSYQRLSSGNSGGYSGGSYSGSSGSGSSGSGSAPQYTKTCGVCHGTGTCNICGGDGWVTAFGMGKDHYCTSCRNHDGRCSSCNGRGTWKE